MRRRGQGPDGASLAGLLARHVGPRGLIADIGCGHGRDTAWLDGVWCCASLLHLPKSVAALVLVEFRRVIRASGMLILSIQEGNSEGWDWSESDHVERYFARYQSSEMCKMLAKANFVMLDQSTSPGVSATWLAFVCIAS